MDFVIMMPLGPQLIRSFHISPTEFSWLVSIYNVSAAFAGFCASFFVDRFDRKKTLVVMYAGFTLGTLFCAMATDFHSMFMGRITAGTFGGVLNGMIFAIIGDSIPYSRRGFATGVVMSAFSISSIIGIPTGLILATKYNWNAPFFLLTALSILIWGIGFFALPPIRKHLEQDDKTRSFARFKKIILNRRQQYTFGLCIALMFGAFSIIPFISPYLVKNVGLKESDLATVYFFGGIMTLFSNSLIGKVSDRVGKFTVFRTMALLSTIPIFLLTHLPALPLASTVVVTAFFTMTVSGRFVPFMAMITNSIDERLRGSFMSLFACVQQLGSGVASFAAGLVITETATGKIENYGTVGIIACVMTVVSVIWAGWMKLDTPNPQEYPVTVSPHQA